MTFIVNNETNEGLADIKSFRTQAVVVATAATTTILTANSELLMIFTGTVAGQIVQLPDATTLLVGHRFEFHNNSTQDVTINDGASAAEAILTATQRLFVVLQANTTTGGIWSIIRSEQVTGLTSGSTTSFFNDFLYDVFHLHSAMISETLNGGVGTLEATPVDNTYTGGIIAETGTTVNTLTAMGKSAIVLGVDNNFKAGGQTVEWRVRLSALSSNTNLAPRYDLKCGVQDTVLAAMGDPANGIYLQYSDNINSGQFVGVTRNASISTTINSGIAVAINTWYRLKFVINNSGTAVGFYINDVLFGSSTTNIPTTNPTRLQATIEKKAFNIATFLPAAVNITSDVITLNNTFTNTDRVMFTTTTTLPAPLATTTIYYVVGATATTFQVSTTSGGGAVNLTSQGTGTHTVSQVSGVTRTSLWDWYSYSVVRP